MSASALFFADAGPSAGLGHVVRCAALAEAMLSAGWTVFGISTPRDDAAGRVCASLGVRWLVDGKHNADVVVVDSYLQAETLVQTGRQIGRIVVQIADAPARATEADIVLDGAPGAGGARYSGPYLRETLCGPTYALVPAAFRGTRRPSRSGSVVALGSAAPAELVRAACSAVSAPAVDVVLGPYSDPPATNARVHRDLLPPQVADLFARREVGILGAGQTLIQGAAAGLACVAVILADNQIRQARALEVAGATLGTIDARRHTPERARFASLLSARAAPVVATCAARIIDGGGAARATAAITRILRSAGSTSAKKEMM